MDIINSENRSLMILIEHVGVLVFSLFVIDEYRLEVNKDKKYHASKSC